MRILLPLILLSGCVVDNAPSPSDTAFRDRDINWVEVYKNEIKIAVDNEDEDAYNFFFEEYMRERIRQVKAKEK